MTEKVNPSQFRPAEAFKTAGAIGYGGGTSSGAQAGFVTSEPTEIAQVDPDITDSALNSFQQSSTASSLDVTIDPGEAFVGGAWLCTDTSTTVSLQANTAGQTVFVGWDQTATNEVVIGLAGAFASGSSDTDFRIPLFTFDTDGSGVTNVSDERRLDYSIDIDGSLNFGDDEQASVEYDGTDLAVSGSDLSISDDLVTEAGDIVWDSSSAEVPDSSLGSIENATLSNSSVTVSAGDGLKSGGSVSLGGSITLDTEPADFAGSFLSDDGSDNLQVDIGRGLADDGTGAVQFDEDTLYTLTNGLNIEDTLAFGSSQQATVSYDASDDILSFDGAAIEATGGHDEVPIPQVRELTVADFEGGTLPSDAVGDTDDATVQSSVTLEGDFSLEISRSSAGRSFVGLEVERSTLPQFGDSIEIFTQLTDTDEQITIGLFSPNPLAQPFRGSYTGLVLQVRADRDALKFFNLVDGVKTSTGTEPANISNLLNERLTFSVDVGIDRSFSCTLLDSTGTEVQTIRGSIDSRIPVTGGVTYDVKNETATPTAYFDGPFVERRVGEYYSGTQNGSVKLGNDVQLSGAIDAGPQEAIISDTSVHGVVRSDDDLSAGEEIELVEWDAGIGRRSLKGQADGEGGVYGLRENLHTRITNQLTVEVSTPSDHPFYTTGGASDFGFNFANQPRRLQVTGGTQGNFGAGSIKGVPLTDDRSLGSFRITFPDVSYTNNGNNAFRVGVSDVSPSESMTNGNGFFFHNLINGSTKLITVTSGNVSGQGVITVTGSLSLEYDVDAEEIRAFEGGELLRTVSYNTSADFSPMIQLLDGDGNNTETAETKPPIVEEL